jgi:glutamate-ammonia-ligase adenylyltransferase
LTQADRSKTAFAGRLTRCPQAFEPDRGTETAQLFPDLASELRGLIAGTAGSSPYLRGLAEREVHWLGPALETSPEAAFDRLMAEAAALDAQDLGAGLRAAKRRVALLTGLADLGGVWSLEEVTGALTRFADLAVDQVSRALVTQGIVRGLLPKDTGDAAGYVVIAMGKMGAGELNYSSDIDLICLFDESRFAEGDYHEVRAEFVRITRTMAKTLSEVTAEGYVFRTDLRLRPDPGVTPVCIAMETAERYYESVGRTWERAAHIKARAAGGDTEAGAAYLARLTPFVYRRHLDFAAIQDAHDMQLRIQAHKIRGHVALEGYDLKLGSGGIRQIEFFTQTRQIIAGGRDPDLRLKGTVEALAALETKGWIEDTAEVLTRDYRAHREVEHRLQMIADQQTHALPGSEEGFARLAALMDLDVAQLRGDIQDRLTRVAEIVEPFFAPSETASAPDLSDQTADLVARWPSYPALRSDRAVEIFNRLRPEILARLNARAARPDEAIVHLDGFLAGLPAGVQLFSMFEANPQLIDLVVDIAATAPALASYLARHADVFDAVIGGGFFQPWPGLEALQEAARAAISDAPDYEAKLIAARRWRNEWHFRVGVHHLRGLLDAPRAGTQYADIAEAVLNALWDPVVAEFASKHGHPPGRGAAILAMGSLGPAALTARSDLDLIAIYDAGTVEASDGPKPLPARTYYARLTQAFITALTAPMGPGKLYDVDMRLRPSGRKGPVATALSGFRTYQAEKAWTWEHLALTRARAVAGNSDIGAEIESIRSEILNLPRDPATVLGDVAEMRARLAGARRAGSVWDTREGAGRLQDISLLAQTGALLAAAKARDVPGQLAEGAEALGLSSKDTEALTRAHDLFWSLRAVSQLVSETALDPEAVGEGARAALLREADKADMAALEDAIREVSDKAAAIIAKTVPEQEP